MDATYRWCLTGTPIQNRIEDFAALVAFLRIEHFSHPQNFKKSITTPLRKQEASAIPRLQKLVNAVCLRRTKESVVSELNLTKREDHVEMIELDDYEQQLYDFAKSQANDMLRRSNDASGHYSSILQSILRLRQICNHGIELLPPKLRSKLRKSLLVLQGTEYHDLDNDSCESCGRDIEEQEFKELPSRLLCPHILCRLCSSRTAMSVKSKASKKQDNSACPLCFPQEPSEQAGMQVKRDKMRPENYRPSSKVKALLKNLECGTASTKRLVDMYF